MPGPRAPGETVAERLEKLHQYERQWEELAFSRRDTVKDRVTLLGSGSPLARIGNVDDDHLRLCTLPSCEDNPPPSALQPTPLDPPRINIQALDPFTNVFIVLSRLVIHIGSTNTET